MLATLQRQADRLRSQGDDRSRGQIMADTLVERVTGQATAAAVPVEVNLVMTDQAMLDVGDAKDEPAHLEVYGPIPARSPGTCCLPGRRRPMGESAPARRCGCGGCSPPGTGQLAALDSGRRTFDGVLRRLLIARDQVCRTPWCDAPIRHADHVTAVQLDGRTEATMGQGSARRATTPSRHPGGEPAPPAADPVRGDHHPDRTPLPQRTTRPTTHHTQTRIDLHFAAPHVA